MGKQKKKKHSNSIDHYIVLITALLNFITAVLLLMEKCTK